MHQGVYAVGHEALSDRGRMIAALLAAGPGAALSHGTAAYHCPSSPHCRSSSTSRSPTAPHDSAAACASTRRRLDTTTHNGLPVTTPEQTLAQLPTPTRPSPRRGARPAADPAHRRRPRRAHAQRARARAARASRQRSSRDRCVNTHVLGHEVDFLWPDHELIVETDGWTAHGHRRAFERDRARDAELHAAGYVVLRFTWRQVIERDAARHRADRSGPGAPLD